MPGIGVAGDGTAFVVYSESSSSQFAAIKAAAYKPGVGWSDDITIADGEGTYLGQRWGDYVGVAADPSGSAAVWQSDQIPASDGGWRTIVSRLVLDTVPPNTTAPVATVAKGTLTSTAPVTLTWSGSDAGSGIAGYTLEQNRDGAGFESVATGLLTAGTTRALLPGFSYAFRTEGTDGYGNTSGVKTGPTLLPGVTQQSSSTTYHGSWTTSSSSSFSGGSARHSTQAGAYAQFSFTGRAVGFVTYRSSSQAASRSTSMVSTRAPSRRIRRPSSGGRSCGSRAPCRTARTSSSWSSSGPPAIRASTWTRSWSSTSARPDLA